MSMSAEAAVCDYLSKQAAINAIVTDKRSFACAGQLMEEAPFPAVTCMLQDDVDPGTLATGSPAGISKATVQVDVFAQDAGTGSGLATVKTLSNLIRAALHCYQGAMGDITVSGCFHEEGQDIAPDPEAQVFGFSMRFMVWHNP